MSNTLELIQQQHRRRRYAMKLQQKIDRALESFIRINATDWSPDMSEEEREERNRLVKGIIKSARDGESDFTLIVNMTDETRKPLDKMRKDAEREMEKMARDLPIFPWVESIPGAGALGLATIVALTGPIDGYANPYKLYKRLGFAPYDGYAGSTWKYEKLRPRKLSKDEWTANPFSGEKYSLSRMIAESMFRKQWKGADEETGEPAHAIGVYGEIYGARRAHTAGTHPEWSKGHSMSDGLRIMMKAYLLDLWLVWNSKQAKYFKSPQGECRAKLVMETISALPGTTHLVDETERRARKRVKPRMVLPAEPSHSVDKTERSAIKTLNPRVNVPSALLPAPAGPTAIAAVKPKQRMLSAANPAKAGKRRATNPVKPKGVMPAAPYLDSPGLISNNPSKDIIT